MIRLKVKMQMKLKKTDIIYFDMDDTMFDFSGAKARHIKTMPAIAFPHCKMDFFRKLEPLPGAIETYRKLSEVADTYILTAPSVMNPLSYTEKRLCIEDHLGIEAAHKLIICPNKALCMGEYLIDDIVTGKGQENFVGKLIHFGSEQFPDWNAVAEYFGV